jgi:hypothetical protein
VSRRDMMMSGTTMAWVRGVAVTVTCVTFACASRRSRMDLPREERGVAVLTDIVHEYKDALRERDFERAAELLVELEEGVAGADGITRSHPDFEDVERAAQKARPALERFMRKDKIEKLLASIQTEFARAEELSAELEKDGPSSKRLSGLRDATGAIREMLAEGEEGGYQEEKAYAALLPGFSEKLAKYDKHIKQFGWILRLLDELAPRVQAAVEAEAVAGSDAPEAERLEAGREAMAAFADCRDLSAKYREEPGYSDTLKIETAIGEVSIDEAGLTCEFRRAAIENKVATIEWTSGVRVVAEQVSEAMGKLKAAKGPDAVLAVTGEVIEALDECTRTLKKTDEQPGYTESAKFPTPLGKLNAIRLRDACAKKSEEIGAKNPTLQWRSGLNRLRKRVKEAAAEAAAAKKAKDPDEKINHLSEAIGGYVECMEQARFLGKGKATKDAKPSSREKAEVKRLGKACKKSHGKLSKALKKAKKAAAKAKRKKKR